MDRAFFDLTSCMTQHELAAAGVTEKKALARLDHMGELLARYG